MSSKSHDSSPMLDPGFGGECVIARRDLELLLRGAESERELGYRNLSVGIAMSCALGTLSTVVPRFGELVETGAGPVESLLLILLFAATLAASVLAVFFHRRLRTESCRESYRLLDRHIRSQLDRPVEPDDPRHWP